MQIQSLDVRKMELTKDQRALVDAVLDTSRLELAKTLQSGAPKYLSELAKEARMDRATLAYHLGIFERVGLVTSEYRILEPPKSKGKAARYYSLDMKRWNEAIEIVRKLLASP
jgi:DNA-binding transcriptional ArsR family regulator